jgi:hypothetical protein
VQKANKERDGVAYRQAEAMAVLAEATVAKNMLLAEQLLMLMTTPDSQISGPAALRFIRMRQEEELLKYETAREENHRRLEEEAVALDTARVVAARKEQERRDETTSQVNERTAEMQAQHGEADFGEDQEYPSVDENFGQGEEEQASWEGNSFHSTENSNVVPETEEGDLWSQYGLGCWIQTVMVVAVRMGELVVVMKVIWEGVLVVVKTADWEGELLPYMMAVKDWRVTCMAAVREGVGVVRDQVRKCL